MSGQFPQRRCNAEPTKKLKLVQCKTCPWKVETVPEADIPNYDGELAKGLTRTLATGMESLFSVLAGEQQRSMSCHYSKPGAEIHCAGWLHNQLGPGNNLGLRMRVMHGEVPMPEVSGEQHERYEDTLPCKPKSKKKVEKQLSRRLSQPKRRSKAR